MQVYVLSIYWDYEGSDVIGAYSSREAAEAAWAQYLVDGVVQGDGHTIQCVELNAAAQWGVWK